MPSHLRVFAALPLLFSQVVLSRLTAQPLSIARQGYVFAGGKYSTVNGQQVMSGQIYAEFQVPAKQTHPWPIVMVHGAAQTGTNFTGTADGREGWAQFFLRQGYAVYVVDQPGRGRAAYPAEVYGPTTQFTLNNALRFFIAPERYNLWPQAHLHTQWPGKAQPGDAIFDQFYASQVPFIQNALLTQQLNSDALIALLEKTGPAILMTHSQSGAFGWPVADARPDRVKAVIAVEPSGPPFFDLETGASTTVQDPVWSRYREGLSRPYGVTAVPLTYSPALQKPSDLAMEQQPQPDAADLDRCWLQKSPARQLPNLQKVPILVLTSEASYHATYDHCTVKYLEQAGVHATWTKLGDVGIHGNGHMMMLEKNSDVVAGVILRWLDQALAGKVGKAGKAARRQ